MNKQCKFTKKIIIPIILVFCIIFTLLIYFFAFFNVTAMLSSAVSIPQNLSAQNIILINAKTMEILYEKNAREKAYPASTTKIMTAIITLETLEKYDSPISQKVEVPKEILSTEGSSIYLSVGEKISIEDLLYGLILRSGNDAAVCLSMIIGGTEKAFIKMMNEKASELGCESTNFINSSGLFDKNHYTTAYDLALISAYAMKNPVFREIASAKEYSASRQDSDYNYFYNKNKVVHQYKGGNGIKIGFTKASGRTLVASAERDGTELICVVLNAQDWFNDVYKLFDYGFSV